MANAKPAGAARRLKVYEARIGFYDVLVAAPNQKAALAAFGTHANLFAEGAARVTDDPEAVRAAMKTPGEPVRRMIDTRALVGAARPRAAKVKSAPRKKPAPPPPDRSRLDEAERALRAHDREAAAQLKAIAATRDELEAQELRLKTGLEARRRRLAEIRDAALAAFRRAGGS